MRFKSASSMHTDAYRAGIELGRPLAEISPETVLLFASISYEQDFSELFEGIRDGLGSSDAILFGGTGDGIYETSGTSHYGVCALGIHSGGALRWSAAFRTGVAADSYSAARSCVREALSGVDGPPAFAFLLADGVNADGSGIVAGARSALPIPFFGGLTGDDRKFTRSRILFNGRELEDAVSVLVAAGSLRYTVNAASGWTPTGAPGKVEESENCTIRRIEGMSAQSFMKEQLGKPLGETDLGIVPLATYNAEGEEYFFLRAPSQLDPGTGAITTFGRIETGATVRVCTATREEVLRGVRKAMEGIRAGEPAPAAILVVSCAGRKWLLEDRGAEEVEQVFAALGKRIPLVGFPSFGEIGPFRKPDGAYTETFFHNVTFAICAMGG